MNRENRYGVKAILKAEASYFDGETVKPGDTELVVRGKSDNALASLDFTFENFRKVFDATEFWDVLWVSIVYTVFGTLGALILGLFAAQLMMTAFPGRSVLPGLFLFPYVSPVIAVAFTWVFLLDPFSGTLNANPANHRRDRRSCQLPGQTRNRALDRDRF